MIDERLQELASLYAVGALPSDEAAAFEAEMNSNMELSELVADYEAAAASLAGDLTAQNPPSHLRREILSAAKADKAPQPARPPGLGTWIPWALAACLAVVAGMLALQLPARNAELRRLADAEARIASLATDLDSRENVLRETRAELEAARLAVAELKKRNAVAEMQVATLTSKLDSSYLASIAWDENAQEGILHVRRLPETDRGKAYQLWVIDPNKATPVSGGVFTVNPDGSAVVHFAPTQQVSPNSKFAVSVEKAGGVDVAEGPIVLSN